MFPKREQGNNRVTSALFLAAVLTFILLIETWQSEN